ncbi:hypothetical protein DB346_06020 [Verrucomicrobia bacterium LW23]|nr:hypothetical protein DB346_06020 [Verrucomicrobia bacterium LW23]
MELISVVAVSTVVVSLTASLLNIRSSGNLTSAAHTVAGVLERARSHARTHNTYVWVGFYEEAADAAVPTDTAPPYPGRGSLVISAVASRDGTPIFQDDDAGAPLPADRITPILPLTSLRHVHMSELAAPGASGTETVEGRPDTAFTFNAASGEDGYNRISSDSALQARFPFAAQRYTFYKTVRFSPRGEASVTGKNGLYTMVPLVEIGLVPTHGNLLPAAGGDCSAIHITGITGNVRVYRR